MQGMEAGSRAHSCRPMTLSQPHEALGLPLRPQGLALFREGRALRWGLEGLGPEPGPERVKH